MFASLGKWLKTLNTPAPLEDRAREPFVPALLPEKKIATGALTELSRFDILQHMWGRGFTGPGSKEFYLSLTRPLQLNAQKNLLDLNAGLGGPARLIAQEYKTYVTGMERDPELAAEGMKLSGDSGQGKHATVSLFDPLNFEYGRHADAIMACGFFYSLGNKNLMLERILEWLKPRGQLVMTDFVCDAAHMKKPPIALWQSKEPFGAHPVSGEVLLKLLARHGFDVRVSEDITKPYRRDALQGLGRLTQWLEGKNLSRGSKQRVGQTVDLWASRLAALDTGVKNMRYYVIKTS